jgi:hypothetical protein
MFSSWNQTLCYSRCSSSHFSFCLGIEWLPTRLNFWYRRILRSTISLKYNLWGTSCIPIEFTVGCTDFVEIRSSRVFPLIAFVGRWRSRRKDDDLITMNWSWEMKTSTGGINLFDEGQSRPSKPDRISQPELFPLRHRLNLGTRFLVVEENCDTRVITLQWSHTNDATSPRLLLLNLALVRTVRIQLRNQAKQ